MILNTDLNNLKKRMENDFDRHDERLLEIQLLKRRIERIRREFFSTRPSATQRNDEVLEQTRNVEETSEEEKRNAELNDIKAKLLGRKK